MMFPLINDGTKANETSSSKILSWGFDVKLSSFFFLSSFQVNRGKSNLLNTKCQFDPKVHHE